MLLIKNGKVFDAVHNEPKIQDILVKDGKIAEIGENLVCDAAEIVDAAGLNVYPGFVEAHGHIGLDGYGIGYEGADYNEHNDILSPQLRAIDAIQPFDFALKEAKEAGVTTLNVGPGSA
ncbi:MAG: amidohydrolase, partial [Clostridia bacterium]|nr:amidohydrolase [Clostridia bacterium]